MPTFRSIATGPERGLTKAEIIEQISVYLNISTIPTPLGLQTSRVVVSPKLWPILIMEKNLEWGDIETTASTAGPFLIAFRDSLLREFSSIEVNHQSTIRDLVTRFRDLCEAVIYHDNSRGLEPLMRRLKVACKSAHQVMLGLLAERISSEVGPEAGQRVRRQLALDTDRYPEELDAVITAVAKAPPAKSKPEKQSATNTCEWCGAEGVNFQTHNKVCPNRPAVIPRRRSGKAARVAPKKASAKKK